MMDRSAVPVRALPMALRLPPAAVWVVAGIAAVAFLAWLKAPVGVSMTARVPGTDRPAGEAGAAAAGGDVFAAGTLVTGTGKPASWAGSWPRFRGPNLDGLSTETTPLARTWPGGRPREIWSIEVGEGFAGPIVDRGRIYLMDYDRAKQRDALRCLSLADGAEIWRYSYPMAVKRNHGLTRTVPALAGRFVVAMAPKCQVVCADADTGQFKWGIDLAKDHGTTVPPWYTGQCPLVDGGNVILAPGGPEALVMAVDLATGQVKWKTPNPNDWKMTHASVMPMDLAGRRYYLYCASGGVVAVSAVDGSIAWETASWKINIATVPTPVLLGDGRVFFTGGYSAGCLLLQFADEGGKLTSREIFRKKADVFGATQHSPVFFGGNLYGIRADGRLVCLAPDGTVRWASGPDTNFGLGPVMVADGLILAMDDSATLTLAEATPDGYRSLASASLFEGHDAWAPFALAGGRLLARDMHRMVCLELGK